MSEGHNRRSPGAGVFTPPHLSFLETTLTQKRSYPRRALKTGVEFEVEFGRVAQPQSAADLAADKSARAAETFDGFGRRDVAAKM
jgi:hypothetical protein